MARPKGIIQKRNESKYWLPEGIALLPDQSNLYNKETRLVFIDPEFGEFTSYFRALQQANASTHPKAVQKRREATNTALYGGSNPSNSPEIREKAKKTMIEKYGVEHALLKKEFMDKSRKTLRNNYGVDNPAQHPEIMGKMLASCTFSSEGEKQVRAFIENELNLPTRTSYLGGENPRQLDIKINGLPIAIEFNGAYWHSEANKRIYPKYHLDKYKLALKNNIKLIQIFDFEWENRKEAVQSFLRSALGCNIIKLDARKCFLKEVEVKEARDFLNKYHILGGNCQIKYAYGLYNESGLCNLVTLGIHHRNNKELVLNRYCGADNITVRGGLSKLVSHINRIHGEITTWIDLRFSNGESWLASGWELVHQLPPDYFYYNKKNSSIISKQSRRKSKVNTPAGMTEHEHALLDGLVRIYDCGKIKLRKNTP